MAKKAESRLQLKIRKALQEEFGGFWFKIHGGPFQRAGLPDLCGIVDSKTFFLEVKMPDGKPPTKLQIHTMKKLKEAGANVSVVSSQSSARYFVATILDDEIPF